MELRAKFPELFANETASEGASARRMLVMPSLWAKCAVYAYVNIVAKRRARERLAKSATVWERDESSRAPTTLEAASVGR
jgi:hypothetical protein